MKRKLRNSLVVGLCAAAVSLIWVFPHMRSSAAAEPATAPAAEAEQTASVQTAPLHMDQITQTITAYGTVTADSGSIAIFSVPFECMVKRVLVTGGQQVDNNAALLEIEPSADAKLQLVEASNAVDAANKDLKDAQQRFDLKLATNQDLLAAQQNQQAAQVKLAGLQQRGAVDEQGRIMAKAAGLVSKVDVQNGQVVPAGGSLVQMIPLEKIEIRLGIEPADVTRLHVGQSVRLFTPNGDGRDGKIRFIASRVNSETHLVDVMATPESRDALLLDDLVRGEIAAETKQALVVPRSAVLPEEKGYSLFTLKDGHAVKHIVSIGLSNDREVEIIGDGLKEGDVVVIGGNLELEDGMSVAADAGASQ